MSRKKILWLCSWYPNKLEPFNGDFVQRHARAAALYHDIHVIHIAGDTSGKIKGIEQVMNRSGGLTEHIIYYPHSRSFTGKIRNHFQYRRLFRRAIRKYIIENGKPVLAHVQVTMKAGMAALWLKREYKIPYVLTEHAGIYNRVVPDPYEDRPCYFRYHTRKIIREADHFLPVSRKIGEDINRLVTAKPFTVIPNAVDADLFNYTPPPAGKFRFIHVSNMIPLKNVEGIINAAGQLWQRRQDFELFIIGDIKPAVLEHAKNTGLVDKAIYFTGEVSYERVAKEMKAARALLLFSRTENMPCVLLEAGCSGRPVIASAVGGVPEVVHQTNGILVEPDQEVQLLDAMQEMMDQYSRFNCQLIAEQSLAAYSFHAIGEQFDHVYRGD